MAGIRQVALAATVQTRAGESSEREWVSEYLEESPLWLARPLRTKSWDVLKPKGVPKQGVEGMRRDGLKAKKLTSLWTLPVEPVITRAHGLTGFRIRLAETGCRCAIPKSPKSWKFSAWRRGGRGTPQGKKFSSLRRLTRQTRSNPFDS